MFNTEFELKVILSIGIETVSLHVNVSSSIVGSSSIIVLKNRFSRFPFAGIEFLVIFTNG